MINSIRIYGMTSLSLRKTLFLTYVLHLFTWLFILVPLLTRKERSYLSYFYYTTLKRMFHCLQLPDTLLVFLLEKQSMKNRCLKHWDRHVVALVDSKGGELLFEQANLNRNRKAWLQKEFSVKGLYQTKRYMQHVSVAEKCLQCC